jgi:hypothetical protein
LVTTSAVAAISTAEVAEMIARQSKGLFENILSENWEIISSSLEQANDFRLASLMNSFSM